MSKLFAGLLIAVAAMVGIYAAAATIATNLATTFIPTSSAGHPRIVEFASEVKQAWAEHKAARARCERLTGAEKVLCNAEAKAQGKRALNAARASYQVSIELFADARLNPGKPAREGDQAQYRGRQYLPD